MFNFDASHLFTRAILLVKNDENASVERNALRAEGIRNTKVVSSGLSFFKLYAEKRAEDESGDEIFFCHEDLGDMKLETFMEIFSVHPYLQNKPVIAVLNNKIEEVGAFAKKHNLSGVLFRPYTADTFHAQLELARRIEDVKNKSNKSHTSSAIFLEKLSEFLNQKDATENINPSHSLKLGFEQLKSKNYNEAIKFLNQAAENDLLAADAHFALALAYKEKNSEQEYKRYLELAASQYISEDNWEKYKQVAKYYENSFIDKSKAIAITIIKLLHSGNASSAAIAIKNAPNIFDYDFMIKEVSLISESTLNSFYGYLKTFDLSDILSMMQSKRKTKPKKAEKKAKEKVFFAENNTAPEQFNNKNQVIAPINVIDPPKTLIGDILYGVRATNKLYKQSLKKE